VGKEKAKVLKSLVMPRRPDDEVLTREQLKQLTHRLSLLSASHVEDFYIRAHRECCLHGGALPKSRAVQELVQAWKLLRKWR
jgi:hypothetical protein